MDEVRFKIFTLTEVPLAMLALQRGDIDAYDENILQKYLAAFVRDPNITVTFTPSLRYRTLTLNCARFPTNITAFRRAMAFSYGKYRSNIEIINPLERPQDSYIPLILTEWQVEDQLDEHFYEADYSAGNASLEAAGFKDLDNDGWREYDKNGNNVWDINIDYDDTDPLMVIELSLDNLASDPVYRDCEEAVAGLRMMGIRSTIRDMDYELLLDRVTQKQHSVICWAEEVNGVNPVKLLYDRFATKGSLNNLFYHFRNATIDTELEAMITAPDIGTVKQHALVAHKMLVFEQPQIVVYNEINIGAHWSDKFDGFFEARGLGVTQGANWAVATKVHLKDFLGGPYGGMFKYCLSGNMDALNPYLQTTTSGATVFQYIYEKLWNLDPLTWEPIPGLAYDWHIEQTTANGDILDGQKFTFYLYENQTWHDGPPFSAADVNHSIQLWKTSPYRSEILDIYKVEVPDNYTIELYVNQTGYFAWADTTAFYITPEHIWRDKTNVTAYIPTEGDVIGTGPYVMNIQASDEHISLLRNPDWRWGNRVISDSFPTTGIDHSTIFTTSVTSHSSNSSTLLRNLLDLLPVLQIAEIGVFLFFVVTLIIVVRRNKLH